MPAPQLRIGKKLGLTDLTQHSPTVVTKDHVVNADLVLGMTRRHRKRLVRLEPTMVRKIFTLREFAHLAQHVTPEDVEAHADGAVSPLHAAIEAVAAKRGMVAGPVDQEEFDVVDPFRRSRATYRQSRDELIPAAEITAAYLDGVLEIFETEFPAETSGEGEVAPPREPDVVSQGIPTVERRMARTASDSPFPSRREVHGAPTPAKRDSAVPAKVSDTASARESKVRTVESLQAEATEAAEAALPQGLDLSQAPDVPQAAGVAGANADRPSSSALRPDWRFPSA